MCVLAELLRRELLKPLLDVIDMGAGRHASAVCNTEDVGVHSDGRFAECRVEHDVRGLAAYARKRLQRGPGAWHLAAVQLEQLPRTVR